MTGTIDVPLSSGSDAGRPIQRYSGVIMYASVTSLVPHELLGHGTVTPLPRAFRLSERHATRIENLYHKVEAIRDAETLR